MAEDETMKELEILYQTTVALEKAEKLIDKQEATLERIVLKTIEILANKIAEGGR